MKNIKFLSIFAIIAIPLIALLTSVISLSNQEIDIKTRFDQKIKERSAFFDKNFKTLNQKSQIALRNDSSFRKNVEIIMAGRKDAEGLFMKWVQETNPNANYAEVSALYKDLSRTVEAQREGFFNHEKVLMDLDMQHNQLLRKFPTGFILKTFLGRKEFNYQPISSDVTEQVMKTGKENNLNLF